ncbi:hypothetical protein DUNSADRAFT_14448 [Dunaliella salina]|uniref:Encoded protein n=1 Tax=Dunaliella salina TaxID=3046 RepID=A0ABQ7H9K2_DUNSA|nr:hypothetical protein DUNSADRAFT_14448 [Dunaliella salina]|eukprot:KAF5843533.1 hypothetical protein DUNSADRAFT_14448 [Dunaliella salina]
MLIAGMHLHVCPEEIQDKQAELQTSCWHRSIFFASFVTWSLHQHCLSNFQDHEAELSGVIWKTSWTIRLVFGIMAGNAAFASICDLEQVFISALLSGACLRLASTERAQMVYISMHFLKAKCAAVAYHF